MALYFIDKDEMYPLYSFQRTTEENALKELFASAYELPVAVVKEYEKAYRALERAAEKVAKVMGVDSGR